MPVSVAVSVRDDVRQSAVDRAFARVDVWHPAIALAFEEQVRAAAPGSVVPIDATVTNAGDTPLLDVRLEVPGSGVVARLPSIAPGTSRTVHAEMSLPTSSGSVGSTTVIARDRLGRKVSASTATPYVVASAGNAGEDAGGGGHPSAGPNGSAFSGASIGSRIALALCLAGLGAVALVASRRRRTTA